MRIIDKRTSLDRRSVLRGSSVAALGTVVATTTFRFAAADVSQKDFPTIGVKNGKTLVRMARDIYPHDRLGDQYYLTAVGVYDPAAAKDPAVATLINKGVEHLNELSTKKFGKSYCDIASESDRVAILKEIETTPFFQKIRGDLVMTLYNNPEVWLRLGYEGPSADKGGYINRGFNDLDWL